MNQVQTHHEPTAMELELIQLRAENEALKRKKEFAGSNLKVSNKGAISLYGMGRFPVTLYKAQWEQVIELVPELKAFIIAHKSRLQEKTKIKAV